MPISRRISALALAAAALAVLAPSPDGPARASAAKVKKMTASEALDRRSAGEAILFLDTRQSPSGYVIPAAVNVPRSRVDEWAATADRDALVLAYCT